VSPDRGEPPITLPGPEEQWFWLRATVLRSKDNTVRLDDLRDHTLPRMGKTLDRLQHDLGAHIGDNERELQRLQTAMEILAKDVEDFMTEQKKTVGEPLAALLAWKSEVLGGWRVSLFAASALGSIVGAVIAGVLLWRITGAR